MTGFTDYVDLAAERLGGAVLLANDEFFAPKESLLRAHPAEWREGVYTDRGKWMDGWETRRRRSPGHDWCVVRLGLPGVIHGVVVDTSFFRGNYPESCSIEVATVPGTPSPDMLADPATAWTEVLARSPLAGDTKNGFAIPDAPSATHVRLSIYPDGGVARLRVYGEPGFNPARVRPGSEMDLAAMENGGFVVSCSDMFFGHRHNLILPGRSSHMGDGWETKRRRGPGHDWSIVRLATRGVVHRIEIDTDHFKGNAPGSAMLELVNASGTHSALEEPTDDWSVVLPQTPLQPHARHAFDVTCIPATHARLSIFPDGGVARLRLFGTPA
ncbi:MAG TPA: allantoicase [Gemmatimonadaceae bacterium]|nr:allantoicase [Gemmatimonadaceae bacterium]